LVLLDPCLGELDRRLIAERAVETFMIVFISPVREDDLGFE